MKRFHVLQGSGGDDKTEDVRNKISNAQEQASSDDEDSSGGSGKPSQDEKEGKHDQDSLVNNHKDNVAWKRIALRALRPCLCIPVTEGPCKATLLLSLGCLPKGVFAGDDSLSPVLNTVNVERLYKDSSPPWPLLCSEHMQRFSVRFRG